MNAIPARWIPIERYAYAAPVPGVRNIWGMEANGHSLEKAGIRDGDIAIFTTDQKEIEDGCLYVLRSPHGLTAKYVYKEAGDLLRLHSAHDSIKVQRWQASEVEIVGRVLRVDRDGQPVYACLCHADIGKVLFFRKGGER